MESIQDYLSGPNVISRILIRGRQEIRERGNMSTKTCRLEGCEERQPLEAGKRQENRLFPEDSRKHRP